MGILSQWLAKIGAKSVDDLSKDERATFDQWEFILNKKELSLEDLRSFISTQVFSIEARWKDMGMLSAQKAELIPLHVAYSTILQVLNSPQQERERLEAHLRAMIEAPK